MDGPELKRLRKARGLTQDNVANFIQTRGGRDGVDSWRRADPTREFGRETGNTDRISQAMVSMMENGRTPIPRSPREMPDGTVGPSIHDLLEELFSMPADQLVERLPELLDDDRRGPYPDRG